MRRDLSAASLNHVETAQPVLCDADASGASPPQACRGEVRELDQQLRLPWQLKAELGSSQLQLPRTWAAAACHGLHLPLQRHPR